MRKYFCYCLLAVSLPLMLLLLTKETTCKTINSSKLVFGDFLENISSNVDTTYISQNYSKDLMNYFVTSNSEKKCIESGTYYTTCFVYSGSLSKEHKTYNILLTIPTIVFSDGVNYCVTRLANILALTLEM